jgi:Ran GTPase-activating protein (RanGAP) involved in mRNA processing and transport
MSTADPPAESAEAELRRLVDDYRTRCLWFLREDFYPETREEALRVLEQIERNGDREAFIRAGKIRRWLSQTSSAPSAAS